MNNFKKNNLKTFLFEALDELDFKEMTEVQERVIPLALEGKSLIVESQTGTGKTHSFMIPVIERIDPNLNEVQAVITAPSRELAEQLYQVGQNLIKHSPDVIRLVKYIGGTDKQRQLSKLNQHQQPHIVIGTPGRIFDLMSENALWVQTSRILVIDEGDMTMDLGFLNLVDEIASRMPEDLQMMVFSATIPQNLQIFLNKYMSKPVEIRVNSMQKIAPQIENFAVYTKGKDQKEVAYKILTRGQPYLALVFCNTKQYADEVASFLIGQGLKIAKIHGDISPRERKRIMKQIRNLEYQYVVATDLAARGIDIPGVSMVLNMGIPKELEFFIHRVGRTGRNNLPGQAYTLISPDQEKEIIKIEDKGIDFTYLDYVQGDLREVKARHQKQSHSHADHNNEDHIIKGLIKRMEKEKVKPGYKRKLKDQINQHKRMNKKRK